jgi:dTDP-glucose 4,6-dehydratase
LDAVLSATGPMWDDLRGQRIFITGGTGFFGCWLLESLLWANDRHDLNVTVVALTRAPERFRQKAPHLAKHPAVTLLQGDVLTCDFPEGEFPFVIHAAMEASAQLLADAPLTMLDTIVHGTRRALEFSRTHGTRRFLYTSSGAVYGKLPPEIERVPEDYLGGPPVTDWRSAHAEGKRMAELLCALYHARYGLETVTARAFAFVGPYLALDIHFAIGNFIRDGMRGGPIKIGGDGTPVRSYLYASDLATWLWTLLLRGQAGTSYNVGSEEGVTIAALAGAVASCFAPESAVVIAKTPQPGQPVDYYVPSVALAQRELGLNATVGLQDAIKKTIAWHEAREAGDAGV